MMATVVLARLLTPSDFGVVAMVTTFSLLFVSLMRNGLSDAIAQREEMNSSLASNVFWISIGTGLLLTIAFAGAGSLLAAFYNNHLVAHIAFGFSSTIFLTSLSVVPLALLRRAMLFTSISANNVVSRVVSITMAVGLGWAGWGYWALVGGVVAQCLSQTLGAWILCRWVPRLPQRTCGTGSIIRFAMNVSGYGVLNYAKGNMDNLLVGWYFGPSALGLYKRAFDLFFLPGNQILAPMSEAAVPALSRMTDDPERYRRYLLRAFSILAFIGMGVGAYLALVGKDLILVLLGPKWDEAGTIFRFFAPGIGAMFLGAPWWWIPVSIGRADRFARWGVVQLTVTGLLFLAALPWGPKGVAAAWSASLWILTLPATWYAGKPIRFGIGPVVEMLWKYVLAAVLAACSCRLLLDRLAPLGMPGVLGCIVRIVTTLLVFGTLYLTVVVLLHGGREPISQITRLFPDLALRRKSSAPFTTSVESAAS
jgi:O-antigen/teichoic acid export membrane protein